VAIMADVANDGLINLVYIAVILSLSLGLFNLIPFPALDGGRLLFLVIEAIKGKPLNRKVEGIVNAIGLGLLFLLMIVVTVSDVIGLFK
ncbi:MAG: site-2 protease family protein, partial [Eubacteriales bacterium]|nr:site-2 protease family protein [Eubacteriales bacterium]